MAFDAINIFEQSFIKLFTDPVIFILAVIYTAISVVLAISISSLNLTSISSVSAISYVTISHLIVYYLLIFLVITFLSGVAFLRIGTKKKMSIKKLLYKALRRYPALIGTTVLSSLIIAVGLIVLIIPGVYLGIKLSVAQVSSVLDDKNPIEAIKESWRLTNGNWWYIFALFVLFIIVIGILDFLPYISFFFSFVLIAGYTLLFIALKKPKRKKSVTL